MADASLYDIGRYDRASAYASSTGDYLAARFFELFNTLVRLQVGYSNRAVQQTADDLIKLAIDLATVPEDLEMPHL